MQLFLESDEENSKVKGLNFFDGKVKKLYKKSTLYWDGMKFRL